MSFVTKVKFWQRKRYIIRLDSFLYLFHGNDKHDRFLVRLFRNGLRHQYELNLVNAIFKTVCVRAYFWNMTELTFPFNSRTAYNEVVYQWYLVLFFSTSQRFGTIEQFSAIKWVLCASLRSNFCKNVQKSMIHVYKKAWYTCRLVVLLVKPIVLFDFLVTVRVVGS